MSGNFNEVYFRTVLDGGLIENESYVVTWVEIRVEREGIGYTEGFYCQVYYEQGEEEGSDVDIQTFEGTAIDFERMTEARPSNWYYRSSWDAKMQMTTQWTKMVAYHGTNYASSWDAETQTSS